MVTVNKLTKIDKCSLLLMHVPWRDIHDSFKEMSVLLLQMHISILCVLDTLIHCRNELMILPFLFFQVTA